MQLRMVAEVSPSRDTISSRSAHSSPQSRPTERNRNTTPANTCTLTSLSLLFVIRIPKCASTSFAQLLNKLSHTANFSLDFNPSGAYNWGREEAQNVARQCAERLRHGARHIYIRHFYYLDFSEYDLSPLSYGYVTLVREPVDRFISSYLYYHFSPKHYIQQSLDPAHRDEDLLTCLQSQHEGCTHNLLTKYFCGHDLWCKNGDQRALQTAKDNLKNRCALVVFNKGSSTKFKLGGGTS